MSDFSENITILIEKHVKDTGQLKKAKPAG
jgi:hypothetical protein